MLGSLQKTLAEARGDPDRRGNDRFPIVREVRYKIMNPRGTVEIGTGETINISSAGVLFNAQTPMTPGKRLELSISWPAQLDGKCGLKLVARGRVIRCHGTKVAIEIDNYEFRTAGSGRLMAKAGA